MLSLALENAHCKIKHSSFADEFVTRLSHLAMASLFEDGLNAVLCAKSSIQDKRAVRHEDRELHGTCFLRLHTKTVCAVCATPHSSLVEDNISSDSIQLLENSASFEAPFSNQQLGPGNLAGWGVCEALAKKPQWQ